MRPKRKALLLLLLLPALVSSGLAEEPLSVDEQFEQARELAFSGQRDEARALCARILEDHPGYVDVRILMGRTWAWDKEYDKARVELRKALADKPDYADARNALLDVAIWTGDYEEAIRLADEGLARDPGNPDFLYRKGRALQKLGRDEEAVRAAEEAWQAEPGNREYRQSYRRILDSVLPNKFTAAYRYESFNDIDPWNDGVLQYRRRFEWGSLLGRVNIADRYGTTGTQYEVDAYPRVAEHTYLYLNVGYSSSSLFPEIRYAAEVYHNFPHGWEGSIGFRRMEFSSTSVTIFTGSVAKYVGSWWISLRPNYVRKDSKLEAAVPGLNLDTSSYSAGLTARRYLGSRYEYVGVFVSAGTGDQLTGVPVGGPIESDERIATDGFRLGGEIRKRVANTVILRGALGYREDELTFDRTRKSWYLAFGVEKYF